MMLETYLTRRVGVSANNVKDRNKCCATAGGKSLSAVADRRVEAGVL